MTQIRKVSSRRVFRIQHHQFLGFLAIVLIAAAAPSLIFAKPKLDKNGRCKIPAECTNDTINASCAKLYCRALRAECEGDYRSGECKDIKDEHDAAMCSTFAKPGCGRARPKILALGGLEITREGEVFIDVEEDDSLPDFDAVFDNAAELINRTREQAERPSFDADACLRVCRNNVSDESVPACPTICDPAQY